jgi:hypothetical protein
MLVDRGKIVHILAISVITIGIISTILVYANTEEDNTNIITLNGNNLDISLIFTNIDEIQINTDDGIVNGIPLDELINFTGENCPSCFKYRLIGSDGYKQTVNWDDMKNGILTIDKKAIFPHLAHSFWVKDIIKIEAIEI